MNDKFPLPGKKIIKITDPKMALLKAQKYCAYQERCQQEVRDKLYEWGLWREAVESIISDLISNNFLNEERFAIAFAGGKFRIKKWGKAKIKIELKKRNISDYCIKKALKEVIEEDYNKALKKILSERIKKHPQPKEGIQTVSRNYKLVQYAVSRGYESDLAWEIIKDMRLI